jgi:hypothetical protein
LNLDKTLSLRENADATKRASAPAACGEVDGVAAGTSGITASFSDYVYTYNGNSCPGTLRPHQGSGGANVQKPAILKVVNTQTSSTCSGTSCLLQIWYQVLDGNGAAIKVSGLDIEETVTDSETGNCAGELQVGGPWHTDSTGTMTGPDNWWWCCDTGCNAVYTFNQTFTVNGYTVQIVNGSYVGSHNVTTIQCNNGQGSCPSVVPTP